METDDEAKGGVHFISDKLSTSRRGVPDCGQESFYVGSDSAEEDCSVCLQEADHKKERPAVQMQPGKQAHIACFMKHDEDAKKSN